MAKAKDKEFNITREWNDFVWSLVHAEKAWAKLNKHFSAEGNLDKMSEVLSPSVIRACRTTRFRYAIEDIMRLCGVHGSMKDYFIKTKKIGD